MPINVEIFHDNDEEGDTTTKFLYGDGSHISPNGRIFCIFLFNLNIDDPEVEVEEFIDEPEMLKRVYFFDLSNGLQSYFTFADNEMLRMNSMYWLTDSLLVFLSTDGEFFEQTMYRVKIEETASMEKVCQRMYMLPNKIVKGSYIRDTPKIMYHGEDYVAWVDRRTENAACRALYLIPQNPNNQHLRMRTFEMNLNTEKNEIFKTDRIMLENNVSQKGRIMGSPLVMNNQLQFKICYKSSEREEFKENKFLFGVFLSVNVEKLQEINGLEQDQHEIQENTSAYTIYTWTNLIEKKKFYSLYVTNSSIEQTGEYIMLDTKGISRTILVVNLLNNSFSTIKESEWEETNLFNNLFLHPLGFVFQQLRKYDPYSHVSLKKINGAWNGSRLEDIARRNIILNEEIDVNAVEEHKHIVFKR